MPVYSHSRLSCFENCPLQYRYRYVDRLPSGFQSIEAFTGKCVHEVLEALYRNVDRARAEGPDPYLEMFEKVWAGKYTSNIRVIRPDLDVGHYRALGSRCVRNFWERNHPFRIEAEKIIGLEMRVELTLDPERRCRMIGFVDRVQHAEPGVIEIHDYKTSASLPREGSLRFDRQLPLYEMAIRERFPETREVRLIWHFLAHGAEFVEQRTPGDLERLKRTCIGLIRTIEQTRGYPPRKGSLCPWCEYQETCPEWERAKPVAPPAFPGKPRAASADRADGAVAEKKDDLPSADPQPPPEAESVGEPRAPRGGRTAPSRSGRSTSPSQLRLF